MDGNNNNQDFPEQNNDTEKLNDQTPNQSINNSETGNTYWESGVTEQNTDLDQGNAGDETTSLNDNSYQNNQFQQIPVESQKKRSNKKTIAAAVVLVLIVAIAGTALAFQDRIKNALSLGSKSPSEYYAYVEAKAIDAAVDELLAAAKGINYDDMAVDVSMDLSYDKATVSSLLQGYAGMSLVDFENFIGIKLDQIGMDMTVAMKDSKIYETMGLSLNQLDIISFEIFMDSLKKEMLMRVPELSSALLSQSLDMSAYGMEDFNVTGSMDLVKTIYSDKTGDFLKRYANIITDQIKDVELTKSVDLKVDDLTVSANKLTVTVDDESIVKIAKEILTKAKDDEYLLEMVPSFGVSKEDYQAAIATALTEIEAEDTSTVDVKLVMNVYTDNDGMIIGRDIEAFADGASQVTLGYKYITKGNKSGYDFYVTDETGAKLISAEGSHVEDNKAYDGDVSIDFNAAELNLPTAVTLTVKYEDARSEIKDGKSFTYGKYTLSSPAMMGVEFALDYNVEGETQKAKISANMGTTPIITMDMASKYLDDFKMPAPSTSDEVITDADSWAATLDMEKFITELSTKLGVDVQSIIDSFSGSY